MVGVVNLLCEKYSYSIHAYTKWVKLYDIQIVE